MTDYTAMTGGDLLQACGTDATKWAAAFMQHKEKHDRRVAGWPHPEYVDEDMMICWFANAIMHTHDTITGNGPVILPDGSAVCVGTV